jgi:Zn-dependent peptidase ImmA (M78 family)
VLRSLAHELVHHRQEELGMIEAMSGDTGSEIENEANALAGVLLRDYGKQNVQIYDLDNV